jgi:hypothetical protein
MNRKISKSFEKNADPNYNAQFKPYHIKILRPMQDDRKKIIHVIGNFWTGGSARLVVDIVEQLGHCYEQEIITRDVPPTPA